MQRLGAASSAPRSAKRRPSPVIGSMNPAASPASSSPGTPHAEDSTASGPRHCGRVTRRARRSAPPARVGAQRLLQQQLGIRRGAQVGSDDARVGQAAGKRRDADVASAPDVHLAERAHADHVARSTPRRPSGAAGRRAGRGPARGPVASAAPSAAIVSGASRRIDGRLCRRRAHRSRARLPRSAHGRARLRRCSTPAARGVEQRAVQHRPRTASARSTPSP